MDSPARHRHSPATPGNRNRWLHRYAMVLSGCVVCLIFLGGHVKTTGSGLSVPDWPNTYGHFMFAFPWEGMVGGILWEHTHRMVASVVGIMTFVLTIWTYIAETRPWVKRISLFASVAVLVQGLLGGLTVLFGLPAWISGSHGTLAQIFLCAVVAVAAVTSPRWMDEPERTTEVSGVSLRQLTLITTCLIVAQLLIGAVMRHTGSGLAIPDFPLMFGKWLPPLSAGALARANDELWRLGLLWGRGTQQITEWQILINVLHRVWAFVVGGMITWVTIKTCRSYRLPALRRPALLMLALMLVQISLGILTVLTQKQFTITTMHVVTGAVTLATSLVLTIRARHVLTERALPVPANRQPEESLAGYAHKEVSV